MRRAIERPFLPALLLVFGLIGSEASAQGVGPQPPSGASVSCDQMPALSGDTTTSVGSCVTSTTKIGGVSTTLGGTLVTGGALTIADLATANQLAVVSSTRNLGGLATANSAVLITSAGGVPSFSTTLPAGLTIPSVTLSLPTLGVAIGTSLTLGGGSIGTDAFEVTGTSTLNGNLTINGAIATPASGMGALGSSATNGLMLEGNGSTADVQLLNSSGAVAAQVLHGSTSLNVVGNVNPSGVQASASGAYLWSGRSQMTSPADGIVLMRNAAGTAFTRLELGGTTSSFPSIKINGASLNFRLADDSGDTSISAFNATMSNNIINPGIASDATHTDTTVCQDTTSHTYLAGSGTLGICLGTSSELFKPDLAPLDVGLAELRRMQPIKFHLDAAHDPGEHKLYYGFGAWATAYVLPTLVGRDAAGNPQSQDMLGLVPVVTHAVVEVDDKVSALEKRVAALEEILKEKTK